MKKQIKKIALLIVVLGAFASCTTLTKTMREPNTRVNLTKADFTLSDQYSAEAKSLKILGIDWQRFLNKKMGTIQGGSSSISLASIPVIGNYLADKTANYALYDLMNNNPGYDVVFYPQYETKVVKPFLGIGFIVKITTVKATARLGKLNK